MGGREVIGVWVGERRRRGEAEEEHECRRIVGEQQQEGTAEEAVREAS